MCERECCIGYRTRILFFIDNILIICKHFHGYKYSKGKYMETCIRKVTELQGSLVSMLAGPQYLLPGLNM